MWSIKDDAIVFSSYLFPIASVAQSKALRAEDIAEIRLNTFPPEAVLKSGEVIFLCRENGRCPEEDHRTLQEYASRYAIPVVNRSDVWELMCEPFLDTSFTPTAQERNQRRLSEISFTESEVLAIRQRIQRRMLTYNSIVWEWTSLGHFDVLWAFGFRSSVKIRIFRSSMAEFYKWTHEISRRSRSPRAD